MPPMRTCKRPARDRRVFLANLGKLSEFTARATFARNLFEAGGIEAVTNEGFADGAEMVAAFRRVERPARLPVLVGRGLGNQAVATATALKAAGAAHLYLAGRPKDQDDAGGRHRDLHLRRLRCACDVETGACYVQLNQVKRWRVDPFMKGSINLRGDLAKLSDAELAERLNAAWQAVDAARGRKRSFWRGDSSIRGAARSDIAGPIASFPS